MRKFNLGVMFVIIGWVLLAYQSTNVEAVVKYPTTDIAFYDFVNNPLTAIMFFIIAILLIVINFNED